jgi:dihydrodipicolinate synthase/N-acetylneuraminate lyase
MQASGSCDGSAPGAAHQAVAPSGRELTGVRGCAGTGWPSFYAPVDPEHVIEVCRLASQQRWDEACSAVRKMGAAWQ